MVNLTGKLTQDDIFYLTIELNTHKKSELEKLKAEVSDMYRKEILKVIPKDIKELAKKYPKTMNTSYYINGFQIIAPRFDDTNINMWDVISKNPIILIRSTKLITKINNIETERIAIKKDIHTALTGISSRTQLKEEYPEAYVALEKKYSAKLREENIKKVRTILNVENAK